ncbi:hypothetical protein ASD80_05840 [Devosia sp. Root635]|nr:hypothetical protein ASD80_05840 [Devosia sp. Root635]
MFPAATMAQEDPGWHGSVYDGMATLFYGIPQSDHAEISLACQAGSDTATFVFAFAPIAAVDGVQVQVTLEAGNVSLPIQTTGALMQMDDLFLLEGEVAVDTRLIDLLGSDGMLSVFVEDGAAEYPLDGARQAAAALIETCGQRAETAAIRSCEFDAWVEGSGPAATVIRDGPSGDAAAVADLPGPYEGYDAVNYPTVSVTGSSNGWFRIEKAVTNLYAPDGDVIVVFAGQGWVSGKALGLDVESSLHTHPAANAAIAMDFSDAADSYRVDRLYACRDHWVEVGGTYDGQRVRGWSADTCESQITTCP